MRMAAKNFGGLKLDRLQSGASTSVAAAAAPPPPGDHEEPIVAVQTGKKEAAPGSIIETPQLLTEADGAHRPKRGRVLNAGLALHHPTSTLTKPSVVFLPFRSLRVCTVLYCYQCFFRDLLQHLKSFVCCPICIIAQKILFLPYWIKEHTRIECAQLTDNCSQSINPIS